jgi:hypothetical protein
MIVLNLAAFGVGIRFPFIRNAAGDTQHVRSFFRSSNRRPNILGRCDLPRRPVSREGGSYESPLNPRVS